jgi:hypothetical protein
VLVTCWIRELMIRIVVRRGQLRNSGRISRLFQSMSSEWHSGVEHRFPDVRRGIPPSSVDLFR